MIGGDLQPAVKSFGERGYEFLCRQLVQKWIIPRVAGAERVAQGQKEWDRFILSVAGSARLDLSVAGSARLDLSAAGSARLDDGPVKGAVTSQSAVKRVWWHAASVGELEILWPVILRMAKDRGAGLETLVTVLSDSAKDRVQKLGAALEAQGTRAAFVGYSPWEGDWDRIFQVVRPDLFVTAKYEAWPELWMSLSRNGVPLGIVCAKDRKSLRVCRRMCRVLGRALPKMGLFTVTENEVADLREGFPEALIETAGEPRWDQVDARSKMGSPRAKELAAGAQGVLPRPWGILGSVWSADLNLWKDLISARSSSFLIAPHRLDHAHLSELEQILSDHKISYIRTSRQKSADALRGAILENPGTHVILVDEMGFLSELYAAADWAYVGGGFGSGVHSTIEPAIHGIPISCGPTRAEQFTEISELGRSGQLTLVRSQEELRIWTGRLAILAGERERWKAEAAARLGATRRIAEALVAFCGTL